MSAGLNQRQTSRKKRWKRVIMVLIFTLFGVPPLQVLCVKWLNPPTTVPRLIWQTRHLFDSSKVAQPIQWIGVDELPENVKIGVVFAEDAHFFVNFGFNFDRIQVAIDQHRQTGKPLQGASTITQQCARSLFLWQGRSWVRKVVEAYYTIWMETLLPKKRIGELYVNVIEFGDGIYGIEAGAEAHFNVHAKDLNNDQASKLIAILPNPKSWDPNSLPAAARQRQLLIFDHLQNKSDPAQPQSLGVLWHSNPNWNERPSNQVIDTVVIHTTEGDTARSAFNSLFDRKLSAHYLIETNGQIYQLMDLSKRAWHATYYNNRAIGIEMVGYADSASTWNAQNVGALENLVAYLVRKYGIRIVHPSGDACSCSNTWYSEVGLIGHDQIQSSPCYPKTVDGLAYDKKSDPGPYFPWETFVQAVQIKASENTVTNTFQRP